LSKEEKKDKKSTGQKGGRGTHGSLTKAGKVREQTPKIPKTNLKKHNGPLKQNRRRFYISLQKSKENTEKNRDKIYI
jgi:ribosomal protein S30